MDNGTELTSLAMLAWSAKHRVQFHYIAPGKPTRMPSSKASTGSFATSALTTTCFHRSAK